MFEKHGGRQIEPKPIIDSVGQFGEADGIESIIAQRGIPIDLIRLYLQDSAGHPQYFRARNPDFGKQAKGAICLQYEIPKIDRPMALWFRNPKGLPISKPKNPNPDFGFLPKAWNPI